MNKRAEFSELRKQMTDTPLPKIDVSSAVMEQIRMINVGNNAPIQLAVKRPKVMWITAAALFSVLTTTAISASILPIHWNGASITLENDGGKNARIDAFKELIFGKSPTYKETIEDVLNNLKNAKEVMSLKEASKQFPFPILRPDPSVQPIRSNGVLMNVMLQENGKDVRIIGYRPVFHDIYEIDHKQWIIVTQSLDQAATDHLHGRIDSRSATYIGNWENVQTSNEQMLAMYSESAKANRLVIEYKNEQSQIIKIEVLGTVSKEELIALAEGYTGLKP